jgi:ketosteroid isomerase-like protein
MSEENVEIARRSIEAWNRRDLTTLSALWRSDGEIDWSRARGPLKGVYRGHREREAFWNAQQSVEWTTLDDGHERCSSTAVGSTAATAPTSPTTASTSMRSGRWTRSSPAT